jgi:3-oxoacyl-[acyl-carrier-protein] synthase-3
MPPSILTNADLASLMETDDEWITSRTGIKERRVSHVTGIELSHVEAARALACAGLDARDVELIVYGSCSNDETVPNSASGVQLRLGTPKAAAMDINTACTSFMYGLSTATALIRTGVVKNAVVIGVELISQFMDWNNRGVAVLFGDGAAAVSCGRPTEEGLIGEAGVRRRCPRHSARARMGTAYAHHGVMLGDTSWNFDGRDLQARRCRHGERVAGGAGKDRPRGRRRRPRDPHQANLRIIDRSRSASARQWSASTSPCSVTATCRRQPYRCRWSMRSRKVASGRAV